MVARASFDQNMLRATRRLCFGPVALFICFCPTAESFGVSAQIGSGVVRGGPEARGSTRVPPGFHEASIKKSAACCWGYHLSQFIWRGEFPV